MSLDDNKRISRTWFEAGYGRGDTETMTRLMPPQMLEEASLREQVVAYHVGFPDLTVTIDEQLAEGDRVLSLVTFRGHQTGDLLGIAPTGKPMELTLAEIHTIRDGQIVDVWNDFHPIRVLQQLDLIVGKE